VTTVWYKQFNTQWGFTHVTTSYHPQGWLRKQYRQLKRLLNKAKKEDANLYLGLLEYRNISVDNIGLPTQQKRLQSVYIAEYSRTIYTFSGRTQKSSPAVNTQSTL